MGEVAERIKKLASNGGYKWRRLWTLETRGSLIGSDKVQGTAVYEADDRKIGSVQRVMIDKISGKVAYAVISFGGFLGPG